MGLSLAYFELHFSRMNRVSYQKFLIRTRECCTCLICRFEDAICKLSLASKAKALKSFLVKKGFTIVKILFTTERVIKWSIISPNSKTPDPIRHSDVDFTSESRMVNASY